MAIAERVPFADEKPPRKVRKRVAAALEGGQLVALPTETVYGIAARADDPAAVAVIAALDTNRDGVLSERELRRALGLR